MNVEIAIDDLSDGEIVKLLNVHLREMYKYSPPDSVHALDEDTLKEPSVTFWACRINGELAGCGGLKELSSSTAEIKSMKTYDSFLRKGVAAKLLVEIIAEAERRSYVKLSLETGSHEAFGPSIALYEKYGFVECGPFGDYALDPYSKFYSMCLVGNS